MYVILIIIIILYFIYKNKTNIYENFININKIYNEIKHSEYSTNAMIIVEPRKHKALPFVLQNFTENLNEDWNFIIYHGTQNESMVKSIISTFSESIKNLITLVNLKVKNISVAGYSTMFFCPTFYHNIPTETFLIFQTDSIILRENKENK
jgi:hypothetical protein